MEEEGKGRGFLPSLQVTGEGGIRRHEPRKRDGGGEREKDKGERRRRQRNEGRCGNCGREYSGEERGNESKSGKREKSKHKRCVMSAQGRGYTGHGLLFQHLGHIFRICLNVGQESTALHNS